MDNLPDLLLGGRMVEATIPRRRSSTCQEDRHGLVERVAEIFPPGPEVLLHHPRDRPMAGHTLNQFQWHLGRQRERDPTDSERMEIPHDLHQHDGASDGAGRTVPANN